MLAALIYPHQLYERHPALSGVRRVYLVEDPLFFRLYRFHRQKLLLHRLGFENYERELQGRGFDVRHVKTHELASSGDIVNVLRQDGVQSAQLVDPCDDWLERRLTRAFARAGLPLTILPDDQFLTPMEVIDAYRTDSPRWFFTDFYIQQRKRLGILLTDQGKPLGGKWSFDKENRRKFPRGLSIPDCRADVAPEERTFDGPFEQLLQGAPGTESPSWVPTSRTAARAWLQRFIDERLVQFGSYEDAIVASQPFLFHSVLTPFLNCGWVTPADVLEAVRDGQAGIPLNSLEGFVRQVIGWREYMRLVYRVVGRKQRCSNFWGHQLPMPAPFYDASTGIEPVDVVIRRVLRYGYCHHIERLMVLGNFMLLCEIHPDAIYRWFMELFVDAYDWVMVPNVYGMSQYADGGGITTKPYLSGSAYLLKMSDVRRGDWCPIWDALFWRFIHKHREVFAGNSRMSMMVYQLDRMGSHIIEHQRVADSYLTLLHGGQLPGSTGGFLFPAS